MKKNTWIVFVIAVFCVGAAVWYAGRQNDGVLNREVLRDQVDSPEKNATDEQNFIAQATYVCDGGKNIGARFYQGDPIFVEPGQMPIPAGNVRIALSDGRNFALPQTISASGARYANDDESFIFWNKGDGVLIFENGEESNNYTNCATPPASN